MDFSKYVLTEENYDDQRFGPVTIYHNPDDPTDMICIKSRYFQNEPEMSEKLVVAEERLRFSSPYILRMLYVQPVPEEFIINIGFEYPNEDLVAQAILLKSPSEVLKLMHDILCGMAFLEKNKMVHGNIRPEFIYFNKKEGNYVLLDRLGDYLTSNQVQHENIFNGLQIYAEPLVFYNLCHNNLNFTHNPYKSEVFCFGMVIISMILYEEGSAEPLPILYLYNKEEGSFNEEHFNILLGQIRTKYFSTPDNELIFDFLEYCLLSLDVNQRLTPAKALKMLKDTLWKMSNSNYNSLVNRSANHDSLTQPLREEFNNMIESKMLNSLSFSKSDVSAPRQSDNNNPLFLESQPIYTSQDHQFIEDEHYYDPEPPGEDETVNQDFRSGQLAPVELPPSSRVAKRNESTSKGSIDHYENINPDAHHLISARNSESQAYLHSKNNSQPQRDSQAENQEFFGATININEAPALLAPPESNELHNNQSSYFNSNNQQLSNENAANDYFGGPISFNNERDSKKAETPINRSQDLQEELPRNSGQNFFGISASYRHDNVDIVEPAKDESPNLFAYQYQPSEHKIDYQFQQSEGLAGTFAQQKMGHSQSFGSSIIPFPRNDITFTETAPLTISNTHTDPLSYRHVAAEKQSFDPNNAEVSLQSKEQELPVHQQDPNVDASKDFRESLPSKNKNESFQMDENRQSFSPSHPNDNRSQEIVEDVATERIDVPQDFAHNQSQRSLQQTQALPSSEEQLRNYSHSPFPSRPDLNLYATNNSESNKDLISHVDVELYAHQIAGLQNTSYLGTIQPLVDKDDQMNIDRPSAISGSGYQLRNNGHLSSNALDQNLEKQKLNHSNEPVDQERSNSFSLHNKTLNVGNPGSWKEDYAFGHTQTLPINNEHEIQRNKEFSNTQPLKTSNQQSLKNVLQPGATSSDPSLKHVNELPTSNLQNDSVANIDLMKSHGSSSINYPSDHPEPRPDRVSAHEDQGLLQNKQSAESSSKNEQTPSHILKLSSSGHQSNMVESEINEKKNEQELQNEFQEKYSSQAETKRADPESQKNLMADINSMISSIAQNKSGDAGKDSKTQRKNRSKSPQVLSKSNLNKIVGCVLYDSVSFEVPPNPSDAQTGSKKIAVSNEAVGADKSLQETTKSQKTKDRQSKSPRKLSKTNLSEIVGCVLYDSVKFDTHGNTLPPNYNISEHGTRDDRMTLLNEIKMLENEQERPPTYSVNVAKEKRQPDDNIKKHASMPVKFHDDQSHTLTKELIKEIEEEIEQDQNSVSHQTPPTPPIQLLSQSIQYRAFDESPTNKKISLGAQKLALQESKNFAVNPTPKISINMPELHEFNDLRSLNQSQSFAVSKSQTLNKSDSEFNEHDIQFTKKVVTNVPQLVFANSQPKEVAPQPPTTDSALESDGKRPSLYKKGSSRLIGQPELAHPGPRVPDPQKYDFKKTPSIPNNMASLPNIIYVSGPSSHTIPLIQKEPLFIQPNLEYRTYTGTATYSSNANLLSKDQLIQSQFQPGYVTIIGQHHAPSQNVRIVSKTPEITQRSNLPNEVFTKVHHIPLENNTRIVKEGFAQAIANPPGPVKFPVNKEGKIIINKDDFRPQTQYVADNFNAPRSKTPESQYISKANTVITNNFPSIHQQVYSSTIMQPSQSNQPMAFQRNPPTANNQIHFKNFSQAPPLVTFNSNSNSQQYGSNTSNFSQSNNLNAKNEGTTRAVFNSNPGTSYVAPQYNQQSQKAFQGSNMHLPLKSDRSNNDFFVNNKLTSSTIAHPSGPTPTNMQDPKANPNLPSKGNAREVSPNQQKHISINYGSNNQANANTMQYKPSNPHNVVYVSTPNNIPGQMNSKSTPAYDFSKKPSQYPTTSVTTTIGQSKIISVSQQPPSLVQGQAQVIVSRPADNQSPKFTTESTAVIYGTQPKNKSPSDNNSTLRSPLPENTRSYTPTKSPVQQSPQFVAKALDRGSKNLDEKSPRR